jgi:rhamnosyltransferase subunit B
MKNDWMAFFMLHSSFSLISRLPESDEKHLEYSELKVLLTPIGSHGDVHPFVGMGMELSRRGHRVIVITYEHFQPLVERAGLEFASLGTSEEFLAVANNPVVWEPIAGFKLLLGFFVKLLRPLYQLVAENYAPGETVVVAPPSALGARVAQEKLGVPLVTVHLAPSSLRSFIDPPVLPGPWLLRAMPVFMKRCVFWWADQYVVAPLVDGPLNEFRGELGFPGVKRPLADWWNSPQRILALFPEWFAARPADWPEQTRLCGFPLFDEKEITGLPADLEDFLQAGEPPVIFTPGSAMRHGKQFFQVAVEACERLKVRGLLLTLFPGHLPAKLPASIRHFTYVPFSQVFPRAAAVVHHGGIGTTGQGLAGGIPQLVMRPTTPPGSSAWGSGRPSCHADSPGLTWQPSCNAFFVPRSARAAGNWQRRWGKTGPWTSLAT